MEILIKINKFMKKTILYSVLIIFYSCSTHMNYFEEINNKESVIKLSVISSLRYKEFLLEGINNFDSINIKSKSIPMLYNFKGMKYDSEKQAFIYGIEIGDYNFYNRIKNDTICIKQGNQIIKFKFIK
jgi:hypothetical protein